MKDERNPQVATQGDVESVRADIEKVRADLLKSLAESQRWTITAIGIIVAVVATLQKLL
ncbi:MAG: hypothetical protein HC765_15195 [Brachymonas sp.]|nr:hypothetical protein [Brachymonas sp.]